VIPRRISAETTEGPISFHDRIGESWTVIIAGSVSDDEAKERFGEGESPKP
jgi:hypothetical protein